MTFKHTSLLLILSLALLVSCASREATVEPDPEQVRMQNQMKAMANEVLRLKESQAEIEDLKNTIAAMDSQMVQYQDQLAVKDKEQAKTQPKISPTDPDIINLRGNIYVLSREIDSLKQGMKSLKAMNDSLEQKLEGIDVAKAPEPTVSSMTIKMQADVPEQPEKVPASETNVLDPLPPAVESEVAETSAPAEKPMGFRVLADYRKAYNHALNLYFQKDFHGAIESFRILIEREPQGAYADNSQYWIGECYYSLEDYGNAIKEFQQVFQFPENNKSDHALFKIAISYQQMGDGQRARANMNRFILDYPESELIEQAHEFLSANR
jgi:tol-pal system protein YbgF